MKQLINFWNFGHYPDFFNSIKDLSGLQVWQLIKHIQTMRTTSSVDSFKQKSNCPTLDVKHDREGYYALLLSKNGNGEHSIKLDVWYDTERRLIWLIRCKVLAKNPLEK
ncbi:MAG: hypothetical protein K8823_1576 [Cenarchaeum symbiont of Oopsacas minuta]|nr:hypothetical protein [Cenarchaeum symbiont of Oopsacas minuta]